MSFSTHDPFSAKRSDTIIGIAVSIVFVIGLATYLYLEQKLAENKWLRLNSTLPDTYGITKDTPIKLAGVTIGKVDAINLSKQAKIDLTIKLDRKYAHLYTSSAKLSIDGNLGLSNVITGSSITFISNSGGSLLMTGSNIDFEAPDSINDWIDKLALNDSITSMNEVLNNFNTLLLSFQERQSILDDILSNTTDATTRLAQSAEKLNHVMDNSLLLLQQSNTLIQETKGDVKQNLVGFGEVLAESKTTIKSSANLLKSLNDVSTSIPPMLDSVNHTLIEVDRLTRQLQNHWLIGNSIDNETQEPHVPILYPTDWSVYEPKPKLKSN